MKDGEAIWRGVRGQGKARAGSVQRFAGKIRLRSPRGDAKGIDE